MSGKWNDFLSKVDEYRQGVLLASAGALLHNLGKVSSKFVEMQLCMLSQRGEYYFYQNIVGLICDELVKQGAGSKVSFLPDGFGADTDITPRVFQEQTRGILRTPIGKLPSPFDDRKCNEPKYCIGDLLEFLGVDCFRDLYSGSGNGILQFFSSSLLTHLMNKCHHGASGGEKQDIYALKQRRLPLYIATPLGFESPAPEVPLEYDRIKEQVEAIIQKHLSHPENFSLLEFMKELEPLLRQIPADTERPLNDITVWDIGHSGMAFLKAGIWSANKSLSHDDFIEDKMHKNTNHPRWRLWQVRLNGLDYLTGAVSVADLRVRQRVLREYLNDVRSLLEEQYPIATEIYRDENGGIYVFPDSSNEQELKIIVEEINKAIEQQVDNKASRLTLPKVYGIHPTVKLSKDRYHIHPECEEWQDGQVSYIGNAVLELIQNPPAAVPIIKAYESHIDTDICPYCGLRPIGGDGKSGGRFAQKARERKICQVCLEMRGKITEEWWKEAPYSTIWVDEVADINGRVALMVGKFDIEKMLAELIYPSKHPKKKEAFPYKVIHWYDDNMNSSPCPPPGAKLKLLGEIATWNGVYLITSKTLRRYNSKLPVYEFNGQKLPRTSEQEIKEVYKDPNGKSLVVVLENDSLLEVVKKLSGVRSWEDVKGKRLKALGIEWEITGEREITLTELHRAEEIHKKFLYKITDASNPERTYYADLILIRDGCTKFKTIESVSPASSASFARFRRIWEVTSRFWQKVAPLKEQVSDWQKVLEMSEAVKALEEARNYRRLEIVLESVEKHDDVLPFQAYELEVAGVSLGIVPINCKDKEIACITIENLGYIARQLGAPEEVCSDSCSAASWVQERLFKKLLREDVDDHHRVRLKVAGGYGAGKEDLGTAKVRGVRIHEKPFFPVIPVLAEPRLFAVLLPSRAAVELVRRIYRKYEEEMGKVRWRLPLTLGTVFFPKHLPLRIVLDAGWRLLRKRLDIAKAEVTGDVERLGSSVNDEIGIHPVWGPWPERVLVRARIISPDSLAHGRQVNLLWEVPTVMGDRSTFDIWYPWVKLADSATIEDRTLAFKNKRWLHVVELKAGDTLEFYPSTWDFVFLDSPAERFSIAYDSTGRRLGLKHRPYYLEEIEKLVWLWEKVRKGLSSAQRHNLWQLLLSYSRWCGKGLDEETWQRFCRDSLLNAGWRERGELDLDALKKLQEAAASGVLCDLLELFMTILKEGD